MYFLPTSYQNLRCRLMVVEKLKNFIQVFISKCQSMRVTGNVFFLLQYVLMVQAHLSVIFQIILNRALNILLGWLRQVKFEEAKQVFYHSPASLCIGKANISQKQIQRLL